jgi:hypothetical protein
MTSDDRLDATSRELLTRLREMKHLEEEKRSEARSTERFHDLAEEVADKAGEVYELAHREEVSGAADSPLRKERLPWACDHAHGCTTPRRQSGVDMDVGPPRMGIPMGVGIGLPPDGPPPL